VRVFAPIFSTFFSSCYTRSLAPSRPRGQVKGLECLVSAMRCFEELCAPVESQLNEELNVKQEGEDACVPCHNHLSLPLFTLCWRETSSIMVSFSFS
jgi:hypothetical protein